MKNRKLSAMVVGALALLLVVALAGAAFAASGKKAAAGDTCLVTDIGGLNDRSFNQLGLRGPARRRRRTWASTAESSPRRRRADYIPNLLSCVKGGADLTIGVGFLMADAIARLRSSSRTASSRSSTTTTRPSRAKPANVRGILFREQEAGYLAGWTAIKELHGRRRSRSRRRRRRLKIPPVDRYIAGYMAGAKAANPKAKVLVRLLAETSPTRASARRSR